LQRVLTTVTLLGLLVATAAAFVITEHLKLMKSAIAGTQVSKVLSPTCHCATDQATVSVRLRHRDHVTVTIVDAGGNTIASLASDELVQPDQPTEFPWDGRTDAGAIAPDGVYYPRVDLSHDRHTFDLPNKILLDTQTPKVLSASRGKAVLLVGPGRSVAIHYAFNEAAHAVLYLGHRRLVVGRPTRTAGKVKWAGTGVAEGTYTLSVAARDVAGNETPVDARRHVTVVVRYIIASPRQISVRAGARLKVHVQTAARRYTWRLGERHGARRGKVLRLRAPTTPGTYRLVVTEHEHSSTAVVRVRAK
jgi:FlgD Ig-like domain